VTCSALTTNTTCAANTECVWIAESSECGLNEADETVYVADYIVAAAAVEASTAGAACTAITTDTACTANTKCVWSAEITICRATIGTAESALAAASAPAGVQGFYGLITTCATTCGPATVSATTCSDPDCELETQGTDTSCVVTTTYALSAMSAKCGTNGAAALSTAQAANGLSSSANTAAPTKNCKCECCKNTIKIDPNTKQAKLTTCTSIAVGSFDATSASTCLSDICRSKFPDKCPAIGLGTVSSSYKTSTTSSTTSTTASSSGAHTYLKAHISLVVGCFAIMFAC